MVLLRSLGGERRLATNHFKLSGYELHTSVVRIRKTTSLTIENLEREVRQMATEL
jgi:hypothetical protein